MAENRFPLTYPHRHNIQTNKSSQPSTFYPLKNLRVQLKCCNQPVTYMYDTLYRCVAFLVSGRGTLERWNDETGTEGTVSWQRNVDTISSLHDCPWALTTTRCRPRPLRSTLINPTASDSFQNFCGISARSLLKFDRWPGVLEGFQIAMCLWCWNGFVASRVRIDEVFCNPRDAAGTGICSQRNVCNKTRPSSLVDFF